MLKVIEENVPAELRDCPHWVVWKAEPGKDGKLTKVPYNPNTGRMAKSTNPFTWGTFEKAVAVSKNGGGYAGIGFVFSENDPYAGVDFDECRDPVTGVIKPLQDSERKTLNTYTEVSPSGTGLKCFLIGKLTREGNRKASKYGKFEVYDKARFFTVTGHKLVDSLQTVEARQTELEDCHSKYIANSKQKPSPHTNTAGINMDDAELLNRARKAKNGALFDRLFNGNWTGYSSQSEADQAFCNLLAFWTGRNPDQMERIFRQSGLYREKDDIHPTYLRRTIQNAIDNCQTVFNERSGANQGNVTENSNIEHHIFWEEDLTKDKDGKIHSTIDNALIILQNDENLNKKVALNEFSNQVEILSKLPWGKASGVWIDSDDAELRYYYEKVYHYTGKNKIFDAFTIATTRLAFHPVKDYLNNLKWDGKPRLDTLLIVYLGAADTEYTRTVTRKTFVAGVARVFKPGIKFDTMLVLVGRQGLGKSTLLRLIAGDEWFSDDLKMEDMKNKAGPEKMPGKWIIEVAELAGLRKTEVEDTKSFLSRKSDRFREPYGRRPKDQPRQCILIGTTNAEEGFLRDQTGNRRFWPVAVYGGKLSPWDLSEETRNQIWAEAKFYYEAGETLYLTPEVEAQAVLEQEAHTEESPWFGLIEKYLSDKTNKITCGIEIWIHALCGDKNKYGRKEQLEIANVMRKMPGWELQGKAARTLDYGVQKIYRRCN